MTQQYGNPGAVEYPQNPGVLVVLVIEDCSNKVAWLIPEIRHRNDAKSDAEWKVNIMSIVERF